jgi:hypothetical protein
VPSTLRITARPFEDFRVRHESELAALYKRTRAASWKITEEQWAAAIYSGAISQASQPGGAEQELATKAYLISLHARDLALALAVRLGCSDAIEHFAIEYMWLLRGLAEHITDDNGRVIALTKEVFDELCGPQNADGRRKSIFENFDGRVSLITWLREFAIQRETGRPPTAAEIRLQPSNIRRDMRAEFLGFLELLDTLGAAPEVLPRHRFASRLWLAPLAVLVVASISVKAATTRQSQRFATASLSAFAENHGDRGVLQPTSREAPFQFEQSTFTSASSDFRLGSDSSGSQSRQADQFAGDIEILFSPAEAGARFDATRVSDTRLFAATAPSVATARQKSPLADRTISRSASNSAMTKPDQVVRVEEARYATNRAWVLTSGGVISRSNDGGRWQPLGSGTDRDLIAGAAPSAEVCWVVGRAGTILRTTDCEQWERIPSPAEADLLSVAATVEYSATVLTADGRRLATDNVGETWQLKVPNAGPEASRNARPKGSQVAAASNDSKTVNSQTEQQESKSTPTPAPMRSVVTGTFAGQLFGYAGGHIFSTDLIVTLVGAGKEVTGAWTSVQGKSGKVTGTLAGSNIARLRLEQLEPCAGTYAGSAVIVEDGQRLHGSYTGTDCNGQVDASFIVVRH